MTRRVSTGLSSITSRKSCLAAYRTRKSAYLTASAAGLVLAFGSNLMNNLPAGLIAGSAVQELAAFHKGIIDNLKLAFSVFINEDVRVARTLIEEKSQIRAAELAYAESHLARLREGRPESVETSSLHLDILRDLKRIHSHICSVAYPILETAGELHPNRLRDSDAGATQDAASSSPPPVNMTTISTE